jgi:hypothetical protein
VGPNSSIYRIASVGEDTRLLLWDFERLLKRVHIVISHILISHTHIAT